MGWKDDEIVKGKAWEADSVVEEGGFRQGLGNLAAGAVRGAGSIGATLLAPVDAAARAMGVQNDFIGRNDRRSQMDAGLQTMGAQPDSLMYQGGKLGAEVAGTAGVGGVLAKGAQAAGAASPVVDALATAGMRAGATTGVPNALLRALGGGAVGGLSAGAINPGDAGAGAAIGAALPGAMQLAGKAGAAVGNQFRANPNISPIADAAINKFGMPLGYADVAQGKFVKAAKAVLDDAPITGGMGAAQREAKQEAFNKAVGGTFGAAQPKLTAEIMDQAKERMGKEFDRIWNNNVVLADNQFAKKLFELEEVAKKLPEQSGRSLVAEIRDLWSKAKMVNGGVEIPGETANRFQQHLRGRVDGGGELKKELNDLRQSLIANFNRSVSPEDAAALTRNRAEYKAFKTVEPLLNKGEVGVAGRFAGDVPAALLPQAVNTSYSRAAGTPLAELSQIGSQFLVDRVPQTGGSIRALIQSAAPYALGAGAIANPAAAAAGLGGAAALQKLLSSNALARTAVNGTPRLTNALSMAEQLPYRLAPAIAAQ